MSQWGVTNPKHIEEIINNKVPIEFSKFNSLYYYRSTNSVFKVNDTSHLVIAFDIDGTLIRPISGGTFPKGVSDWKWINNSQEWVKKHYLAGYRIILISNQSRSIQMRLNQIKLIIQAFENLSIGLEVYVASEKDIYRKPSPLIWQHIFNKRDLKFTPTFKKEKKNNTTLNNHIVFNQKSIKELLYSADHLKEFEQRHPIIIYVGDAAGRKNDFSNSDRLFAINGSIVLEKTILFFTPEEFNQYIFVLDKARSEEVLREEKETPQEDDPNALTYDELIKEFKFDSLRGDVDLSSNFNNIINNQVNEVKQKYPTNNISVSTCDLNKIKDQIYNLIIIIGPPSIGKTYLSNKLKNILQTNNSENNTDNSVIIYKMTINSDKIMDEIENNKFVIIDDTNPRAYKKYDSMIQEIELSNKNPNITNLGITYFYFDVEKEYWNLMNTISMYNNYYVNNTMKYINETEFTKFNKFVLNPTKTVKITKTTGKRKVTKTKNKLPKPTNSNKDISIDNMNVFYITGELEQSLDCNNNQKKLFIL